MRLDHDDDGSTWTQYQKLVLAELERCAQESKEIKETLAKIQVEIAMLKVKSGAWGALAGVLTVLMGLTMKYFSKS